MRTARPLFTFALCLLASPLVMGASGFRIIAQRAYNRIALGVEKKDLGAIQKALKACGTEDFVFVDPFSIKHNLVAYSGLLLELALPNGNSTKRFQVQSVKEQGSTAIVTVRSQAAGAAGKPMTIRTSRDTWIREKGGWRLKKVVFTAPASSLGFGG